MRIIIATVQTPFVRGGAEILAEGLRAALCSFGHEADITAIPFKYYPAERILDHILACRLLDVTESFGAKVDRVIGLKFPAYLLPHPNKVLWVLHQHRPAYDLWEHPLAGDLIHHPKGMQIRAAIWQADQQLIPEAKAVFTLSATVSKRLQSYSGIASSPLYNPPANADQFYCADAQDYFFFPSRLNVLKRQTLVVEALARTRQPVRVRFAGAADNAEACRAYQGLAQQLGVASRAEWLGVVGEEEKQRLYANSLGVIFSPVDEDYGYVTLEAMLSGKPVITCTDSGGPLEFVVPRTTGMVTEPSPEALAEALDTLWDDRQTAARLGKAGLERYHSLNISWRNVAERLLA